MSYKDDYSTLLFDESSTENLDAKKAFNIVLHKLVYFETPEWEIIHGKLNENATEKGKMSDKDCYKVGLTKLLQGHSLEAKIEYAKIKDKKYIYNGEYWVELDDDLLKAYLRNAALKLGIPEALARDEGFSKKALAQFVAEYFYERAVDTSTTYLSLKNGLLKIKLDGQSLIPFDPKIFQTYQLDYNYDSSAINQEWLNFIDTVLPDKDTQKTLQQSLGYLFIRNLKLEKAFFLYGTGANGKSVIFEVIKGLLAPEMITHNSLTDLTYNLPYFRYQLDGKLINYASDISMKKVDAAVLKQLVSGEPMVVRQIESKSFLMKDYAKLIFNVNKINDADIENTYGFFRRMIFIPFEVTISPEKQDKDLHKKLLVNKAGILNWIIEGLQEVIKNQEIYQSKKCEHFLANWKKEASPIQLFLDEHGIEQTAESTTKTISFAEMFKMYGRFCKAQNEKQPS